MHHRQDAHQKGSDNSASARVSPQFQSRPFGLQAQSETTTPQQQETPDDETQLERAKRFGPDFSRVRVRGEGPPPTIQSKLFFGEQEEPVTDAIAQPVRSMPAPRINLRPIPRQDAESVGNQPNPLAARMMPPIQRRDAESVGNQPNPLAARMMPPIPRQDAESVGNQPNPLAARMMPVVQRQPQPIVSIPRQSWIQRIEEQPEAKLEQEDESAPVQAKLENATVQRQSEANVEEEAEDSLPVQTQLENATVQRQSEGEQESENEDHSMQLVQPKLTVGAPGDKYEIEADSMAERVMSMNVPDAPAAIQRSEVGEEDPLQRSPIAASITPLIHRQDDEEDVHSQPSVQRAAEAGGFQASSSVESGLASQQGGGSPLDEGVRSFMEPRFGNDFSSVRIHTGSNAVQMNKELHAQAFTHGSNIYFNAGRYNPGSNEGKRLLAHELTHVVQQTGAKKLQQKPIISLKSNKQTAQAKQLPGQHPKVTTSNEQKTKTPVTPAVGGVGFSGSLGLSIQAKADPGQILEQLKNTPPTNAPAGYDQAQASSTGALEAQKQELEQSLPKIPAPTGLPAQKSGSKETQAKGMAPSGNKETPAAGGTKEKSGQAAKASKIEVKEAAPPRPIKPTQIAGGNGTKPAAGGNSGAKAEQAGNSDPQLSQSAQKELASVRLDTSQISTKVAQPSVDLTGEADPSQMDSEQQESSKQVSAAKAEAAKEINKDFGENNIFPEDSKETLQATKGLSAAQVKAGNKGKVPVVPGEVMGGLNQSLAPVLKERIGTEQQKYTVGKQKFDKDTAKAKTDSDKEIAKLNQETSQKQLEEQKQAKAEVQASKQEWQTELTKAEKDYQDKAGKATQDQKKKIDQEKLKGEQDATKHIEEAEQKAEQEKQKAENEASQKKEEKSKESGGFWGWAASAATAVIDGLKQAVNFIYDNLRKAVNFILEQAKKLAMAAIDLARKAIVGLIEGLGTILKGLVNVVFAAFPEIAKKINSKIDKAINKAVNAVNTAADLLKKGVAAALDFLANALDALLAAIQSLYNAVFDAIGAIIEGVRKLLEGLGNLVEAAQQMPGHFMGQLSEEVLGMDLSQPLAFERSKEDCAKCDMPATAKGGEATAATAKGDDKAALLNKTQFTEDDFAIDEVAPFDVDPEFVASLNLQEGGEVEFGSSNDPANSMEAIKAELAGGETEGDVPAGAVAEGEKAGGGCCDDEQSAEAKLQEMMAQKPEGAEATQKQGQPAKEGDIPASMKTIGPLSVGQRAKYMSHQMIQGVKQWFAANWPALLAGAIAALAAFVGLNILTGGAITAALPPLMQVVGAVMGGVALANIAGHVGSYLSQGWAGNIGGAAKSLARGLAAGAVELVFALLFSVGAVIKALKGGLKGTAKAVKGAAKNSVKTTVKSVKELGQIGAKGAKTAFKNGKIMLQGLKGGFAKGTKSLDDLARRLGNKLRFNKFKIQRQGQRIQLLGHINPWVLLANGSMEFVESKNLETTGSKPPKVGDKVKVNGEDAIVIARNKESIVVSELQKELPELRKVAYEVFGTRGLRNLATKTKTLPKTPQDWIQWAADNPDKVKGLNVQGVVEEYGNAYPEAVNKFLTEWVSGKFTRRMKNSRHVGDLNSLGMPVEVLDRLTMPIKKVNKEEKEALKKLRKLALMMRPSNPAHATGTRDITLAKPTNSLPVPQGTSMHIKDIAKNAKENLTTEFMEVTIKVDEEYRKFAFVHDEGAIRLLPSEQATGLKPATKEMLENNTALIPLPEGNVTTAISSQYTPPVSTGLGDKARGLVGTSLYKDGEEIKYLVVSRDKGKTYYLEEAKNVLDEKGNIPTNSDVMIVGSDIDLLAILSPNGEFNNIAAILDLAKKHPETFNALLEAFRASKRKVAPLEKEGKTFKFPSPASDIQHGPQIPYLIDELLQRATQGNLTREELKQMPRQELQQYISKYRKKLGETKFREEVEAILGTADVRTVLTIKGKIYTIPVRDVPMLYKLLGHEFPIAAYLPL